MTILAGFLTVAAIVVLALRMCYEIGRNAAAIKVVDGVFMAWLDRTRIMPDAQRTHALAEYDRAWCDFKAAFPTSDQPPQRLPFVRVTR